MILSRLVKSVLLLAAPALLATAAHAGEPNWPDRKVTLQVQEQPLPEFLRELFRASGLRALPSDALAGRVSGRFSDRPEKIFTDVVRAYDLIPYYDGAVMHVSASKDMQSKSVRVPAGEIDKLQQAVAASKLVDRYQSVEWSRDSGVVKLRGAPEFVHDMVELIATRVPREQKAAPVRIATQRIERQAEPVLSHTLVFRTFPLRYASAADQVLNQGGKEVKIPGVVSLMRSMTGIGGSLVSSTGPLSTPTGESRPSLRGKGLRRFDRKDDDSSDDSLAHEEAPQVATATVGDRQGVVRIEADPNQNAVIVRDYEDSMQLHQDLIAQLDKAPQLIEIQVTIVDVDRGKLDDLGVNWQFNDQRNSVSLGGGIAVGQDGGLTLNTVLGNAGNFLSRINALSKTGSAQVISRPQVLTLSNLEAVLATDQSFFVRVAGREDVDLFDVSVGTSLRVVPAIAGDPNDPQIRLRVAIEDGSLTDKTVDNIPIVDRARLTTQAVIFDGQSLLLGGLVRDETSNDTRKVPVLGDVPIAGRLFKRKIDTKSTQERLFLISPRIVPTEAANSPARLLKPPAPLTAPAGITAAAIPAVLPREVEPHDIQPATLQTGKKGL
jgi:type III secretion protein C